MRRRGHQLLQRPGPHHGGHAKRAAPADDQGKTKPAVGPGRAHRSNALPAELSRRGRDVQRDATGPGRRRRRRRSCRRGRGGQPDDIRPTEGHLGQVPEVVHAQVFGEVLQKSVREDRRQVRTDRRRAERGRKQDQ